MDPYIGEIAAFALNFVPPGWALCNGAILKIEDYPYVFNLIGTRYGGDGITNFALPDLRSRVVLGQSEHNPVGKIDGSESVVVSLENLPRHTHVPNCSTSDQANSKDAANAVWSASEQHGRRYAAPGTTGNFSMNRESIMAEGGGQPHENRMPVLAVVYCIALSGEYPSFG